MQLRKKNISDSKIDNTEQQELIMGFIEQQVRLPEGVDIHKNASILLQSVNEFRSQWPKTSLNNTV